MPTFIRLTDYKDSDSKEQQFKNLANFYTANQNDFSKIPGSPIAYWVTEQTRCNFEKQSLKSVVDTREGMATADNNKFTRQWYEANLFNVDFNSSRNDAIVNQKKWFPYASGGDYRRYYGNHELIVNWFNDGEEIKNFKDDKGRVRSHNYNLDLIFSKGLTWTSLSSNNFAVRIMPQGFLFSGAGTSLFTDDNKLLYVLAFLNRQISFNYLNIINPTMNFTPGNVGKLPIIFPKSEATKQIIDTLAQQNIDISKEEWDSRETSWDFRVNELIHHKTEDGKISSAYQTYCDYWCVKFIQLHANEEELNRLFIDIYELQDELTPDVDLGDITILKQESKIVDGELVFQADEIMKQFVSYGVGCMFGRYSLDQEGLVVANMNQEIPTSTIFEIDDDNVIPVLEDDYFTDDIASRFIEFVKVAFGSDHHAENIRFIEDALGTTIRKYFVKGFYDDHIKRYKKRPIYWMVSSPKKSFNALIYMHRYGDDIFARIQNNYLREYISKLEAASHTATTIANDESNSSADRKKATKEIDEIAKKLDEIIKFDRDKLTQFAQSRTPIDLDDGVKVNYCKFEEILYPISGLCK